MGSVQRLDADEGAILRALLEHHAALDQGEQGVVAPHADVVAGVIDGAALTDQNVARHHRLTAGLLQPEATAFGVAPVAGATACFFMSHLSLLLLSSGSGDGDVGDAHDAHLLTVAVLAPIVLAALLLEDDDLLFAGLLDQLARDGGARDRGSADLVADHQDFVEGHGAAFGDRQLLDDDDVARLDPVLLATRLDDCKHG